jgi:ketosteroid isomerase-like protein
VTYPAGFLSGALALGSVASCPRRKRSHKGVIERVRAQTRDAIERFFEAFKRGDLDALDDLVHDDYVEEYPQSGERIRGKHNLRAVNENYPGLPTMIEHSYVLSGDLGVMKMTLDYDGNRIYACEIVDFEDGKIKRARAYFAEPFEAPEWRAQWVEKM